MSEDPADQETTPSPVKSGKLKMLPVLDWSRYSIEDFLGEGGMGEVYRAYDPRLKRRIAIKFLTETDRKSMEHFIFEARAQARIEHNNICKIFEIGKVNDRAYIAMQLIDGMPLQQTIGILTVEQKAAMLRDAADAIHAAHRQGMIHRDVKPGNILVERDEDGRYKAFVVDFGLARPVTIKNNKKTRAAIGTPSYMAPEQANREPVDRRVDVFGLGATLYACLCGYPPFLSSSPLKTVSLAAVGEFRPLRDRAPHVPLELAAIVARAMARRPDERYQTARAMADDLQRFLDGDPVEAMGRSISYRARKFLTRHFLSTSLVTISLLVAAALGGLWLRSIQEASRRELHTAIVTEAATRVEAALGQIHSLPIHELEDDYRRIQTRLEELETAGLDDLEPGPLFHLRGRSLLAMGQLEAARTVLDASWDLGYGTPNNLSAIGRSRAELHTQRRLAAELIAEPGLLRAAIREADRELGVPALLALKEGRITSLVDARDEVTIAMLEGDHEAALSIATAELAKEPWRADLLRLAGEVELRRGLELGADDQSAAIAAMRSATAYLDRAADIARSDPLLARRRCAAEVLLARKQGGTASSCEVLDELGLESGEDSTWRLAAALLRGRTPTLSEHESSQTMQSTPLFAGLAAQLSIGGDLLFDASASARGRRIAASTSSLQTPGLDEAISRLDAGLGTSHGAANSWLTLLRARAGLLRLASVPDDPAELLVVLSSFAQARSAGAASAAVELAEFILYRPRALPDQALPILEALASEPPPGLPANDRLTLRVLYSAYRLHSGQALDLDLSAIRSALDELGSSTGQQRLGTQIALLELWSEADRGKVVDNDVARLRKRIQVTAHPRLDALLELFGEAHPELLESID